MTASFSPFLPHHQIALGELALRLHALRDLSEISRGEGGGGGKQREGHNFLSLQKREGS